MKNYCKEYFNSLDEHKLEVLFGWVPFDIRDRVEHALLNELNSEILKAISHESTNVEINNLESRILDINVTIRNLENNPNVNEKGKKILIEKHMKKLEELKSQLDIENKNIESKLEIIYNNKINEFEEYVIQPQNREGILAKSIIMTTTNHVDGYLVEDYLSIESVEIVLGTGVFSEYMGEVADLFGARSTAFEIKMQKAKRTAANTLKHIASSLGGHAVIGVDLDYTEFSSNRTAIILSGTVVKLKKQLC